MLPFGSIASNIPLILLAFAYTMYLGAFVLKKSDSSSLAKNPEPVELTITEGINIYPANTIEYFQPDNDDQHQAELINQVFNHFESQEHKLYKIPYGKIHLYFPGSNILSRPPPFVA